MLKCYLCKSPLRELPDNMLPLKKRKCLYNIYKLREKCAHLLGYKVPRKKINRASASKKVPYTCGGLPQRFPKREGTHSNKSTAYKRQLTKTKCNNLSGQKGSKCEPVKNETYSPSTKVKDLMTSTRRPCTRSQTLKLLKNADHHKNTIIIPDGIDSGVKIKNESGSAEPQFPKKRWILAAIAEPSRCMENDQVDIKKRNVDNVKKHSEEQRKLETVDEVEILPASKKQPNTKHGSSSYAQMVKNEGNAKNSIIHKNQTTKNKTSHGKIASKAHKAHYKKSDKWTIVKREKKSSNSEYLPGKALAIEPEMGSERARWVQGLFGDISEEDPSMMDEKDRPPLPPLIIRRDNNVRKHSEQEQLKWETVHEVEILPASKKHPNTKHGWSRHDQIIKNEDNAKKSTIHKSQTKDNKTSHGKITSKAQKAHYKKSETWTVVKREKKESESFMPEMVLKIELKMKSGRSRWVQGVFGNVSKEDPSMIDKKNRPPLPRLLIRRDNNVRKCSEQKQRKVEAVDDKKVLQNKVEICTASKKQPYTKHGSSDYEQILKNEDNKSERRVVVKRKKKKSDPEFLPGKVLVIEPEMRSRRSRWVQGFSSDISEENPSIMDKKGRTSLPRLILRRNNNTRGDYTSEIIFVEEKKPLGLKLW